MKPDPLPPYQESDLSLGKKVEPAPTQKPDRTPIPGKPGFFQTSDGKLEYIPPDRALPSFHLNLTHKIPGTWIFGYTPSDTVDLLQFPQTCVFCFDLPFHPDADPDNSITYAYAPSRNEVHILNFPIEFENRPKASIIEALRPSIMLDLLPFLIALEDAAQQ